MPSLPELQHAFLRSLQAYAATARVPTPLDPALSTIVGTGSLTAADRVGIYAEMYWTRIVDALCEDFPRVLAAIGAERFHELGRAYLAAIPSTHPSLRHVGRGFADFLAMRAREVPAFTADLARLEWARLAVFDAPDPQPLGREDLVRLAPDAWPGLWLRLVPACELLHAAWPVHEIWASDAPAASWQPQPTVLRVWRQGFVVYQTSMERSEHQALERLRTGASFAEICALLSGSADDDRVAAEAGSLLLRWVEDGVLERGV
jgi:hypothetical protein